MVRNGSSGTCQTNINANGMGKDWIGNANGWRLSGTTGSKSVNSIVQL